MQKYKEAVVQAAQAFGVSASSVSQHIITATTKQLKEFKERSLEAFKPFAIFLDTIHRAGEAFIIALGIDSEGEKMPLGFWQGATENSVLCEELLADMERRRLRLTKRIIFVTDGGKGIIKALRDRFGKKLIHQRCTIHKDRNMQKHLAKRSLYKMMQGLTLCYTQYINRKYEKTGRLWESRYHSCIVDEERYLWAVARYIEQNPKWAKIVKREEEYPYSSARAHIEGKRDKEIWDWRSRIIQTSRILRPMCFASRLKCSSECMSVQP